MMSSFIPLNYVKRKELRNFLTSFPFRSNLDSELFFIVLFFSYFVLRIKQTRGVMPTETATSNSTSCSAWQQSSSTNPNNTSTDTPPDTALLPVKMKYLFYHIIVLFFFSFYSLKIGQVLLRQLLNHQ